MNYLANPDFVIARQRAVAEEIRAGRTEENRSLWSWLAWQHAPTPRRAATEPSAAHWGVSAVGSRSDDFEESLEHYLEERALRRAA